MARYTYITMEQRREIERMNNEGARVVDIAARIGRSAATVYEELRRGADDDGGYGRSGSYSAERAHRVFLERVANRGRRADESCGE